MSNKENQLHYNCNLLPKREHEQLTRNATLVHTGSPTATNFGAKQSKIHQAHWKARNMIDMIIQLMLEKRSSVAAATQVVSENNRQILDEWDVPKQVDRPEQSSYIERNDLDRRVGSDLDSDAIELYKLIEAEKIKNLNLERKCQQLSDQNQCLRESEFGNFKYQQGPQVGFGGKRTSRDRRQMLAELQNLQVENRMLREETMKIRRASKY